MSRAQEVAAGLARVQRRIAEACDDADRDPAEVTLVVVTKFFPATDVRILADLGVVHVGENRHQEAEAKVAECADLALTWHFIGGLQSNKAAAVASYSSGRTPLGMMVILLGSAPNSAWMRALFSKSETMRAASA